MRAGAFKPRTSPYSFQGMGEDGLKLLAKMREFKKKKIFIQGFINFIFYISKYKFTSNI
jgi:3-deoxy-D-arabino-heptulosonate 7-phosphate (DAHP) synthase